MDKRNLVIRIAVKDEHGRVVGETDAVSFKGLLSLAHEDGLRSVRTRVLQLPSTTNHGATIVQATVRTTRGRFTATGDASADNVNPEVARHAVRVAETRAIARAFRLAVNIGEVALEELDRFGRPEAPSASPATAASTPPDPTAVPAPADQPAARRVTSAAEPSTDPGRRAMSPEQRKLLFRLAFELGESRDTARDRVLKALGVERFEWASRAEASTAIDALKQELERARRRKGANGGAHDAA